jgi:FKBP-type peptidyl-prolyl cis-trans isomerase SlyD
MNIAENTVVSIHYTLKVNDQEVDSSVGGEPLAYLHGHSNIVTGLESALAGKAVGEAFDVTVEPSGGYGDVDPMLLLTIPKEMFPEEQREQLQPGIMFQGPHPDNEQVPVRYTIVEVEDELLKVNGNHPLAGETLHFTGSVEEIREASAAEQSQGYPQSPESGCSGSTGCC